MELSILLSLIMHYKGSPAIHISGFHSYHLGEESTHSEAPLEKMPSCTGNVSCKQTIWRVTLQSIRLWDYYFTPLYHCVLVIRWSLTVKEKAIYAKVTLLVRVIIVYTVTIKIRKRYMLQSQTSLYTKENVIRGPV